MNMALWMCIDNGIDRSIGPRSTGEQRDWIGRESGYADFTDDGGSNDNGMILMSSSEDSIYDLDPVSTTTVVRKMKTRTTIIDNEQESIINPDQHRSQFFRNSIVNNDNSNLMKSCKSGPIDVEDLAICFQQDNLTKTQEPPLTRITRLTSTQRLYRGNYRTNNPSSNSSDSNCRSCPKYIGTNSINDNHVPIDDTIKSIETVSHISSSRIPFEQQNNIDEFYMNPFEFCTEKKWLECPVSDYCPLYDKNFSYICTNNILPPCLNDNNYLWMEYSNPWNYFSMEDERLMEDYLFLLWSNVFQDKRKVFSSGNTYKSRDSR